jgi:Flp pilus assembly protein TadG
MKNLFKNFKSDENGVTAVETALVLPFVAVFLFGILQISLVFYDISMTQNSLEDTAREVLMLNNPTNQDVIDLANATVHSPTNGTVTVTTTIISKYGADYANIDAAFAYTADIPFTDGISINKTIGTSIILQR